MLELIGKIGENKMDSNIMVVCWGNEYQHNDAEINSK